MVQDLFLTSQIQQRIVLIVENNFLFQGHVVKKQNRHTPSPSSIPGSSSESSYGSSTFEDNVRNSASVNGSSYLELLPSPQKKRKTSRVI